jgi:hypothetical protein
MQIRMLLLIKVMQIRLRILLLIKVTQICDHWLTDPPRLHFDLLRLDCEHRRPSIFEPLQLLKFNCDADPDPDFHSEADLDTEKPSSEKTLKMKIVSNFCNVPQERNIAVVFYVKYLLWIDLFLMPIRIRLFILMPIQVGMLLLSFAHVENKTFFLLYYQP